MIQFIFAHKSRFTAAILQKLLAERGVRVSEQGKAVVSYGVSYAGNLPGLNKNAGRQDKHQQQQTLAGKGVRTIEAFSPQDAARLPQNRFPMLGRKRAHVGGTDILLALQPEDVALRVRAGAEFFTPYIPSVTEYRVYVYRKQHLGTYQKVMVRPQEYKKVGRNYKNGFAFQLVLSDDVPRTAVELAGAAVAALDLDFGAVDILQGKDGHFYVLEVNTAPGVEGEGRQVIQSLADKIATWEKNGFLHRNGSAEAIAKKAAKPVRRRGW